MRGTGIFATVPILTTVFEFNKTVFEYLILNKLFLINGTEPRRP